MASEPTFGVEDWLEQAKRDIERVPVRLKDGDAEDAAFHLQQAIEKYLKAFLLSKGWGLKKMHDLEALLDEAVKRDQRLERFRGVCAEATGYYLAGRYPLPSLHAPARKDVATAYGKAKDLIKMICKDMGA